MMLGENSTFSTNNFPRESSQQKGNDPKSTARKASYHDEKARLLDQPPDEVLNIEQSKEGEDEDAVLNDPVLNRKLDHPTSNFDTMVHLLKGNIGTGILAMPDAFRNAGWVIGLFGTMLMGVICTHCMHMLVECSHELCRRTQKSSMNFSQVVESAFETGPDSIRKYSQTARQIINVFLCITQLGFCCVYFVFVAVNLHDVIKHYFFDISVHWYLVILLIPMVLLNFVKSLKYLTPASLIASLLTCSSLVIIFFYMLQNLPRTSTIEAFGSMKQLPLYFGTAIYAFEGIGVVLPLENNMKNPQDFRGWNGVLNTSMVIVATLYTAIGFFGYLKYGDDAVLGSVTLLLPPNDLLAQLVRLMMAVAIFLSYGLQFYVPLNIVLPYVQRFFSNSSEKTVIFAENVTRTILVFITFALAICIPNLGAVISLVGAFSSSALALIFPPIIEIIVLTAKDTKEGSEPVWGRYRWVLCKDLSIILFGLIGFVVGSYVSVLNILNN